MSKDYYKILGVDKNASQEEIKQAFRKLAHQHHPDKAGGNAEKFKEINEAYQVLGNPDKRKQFDQFGSNFDQAGFGGQGFNWQDYARQGGFDFRTGSNPFSSGFQQGGVEFDLGDIFGDLFGFGGGKKGRGKKSKGSDIEIRLQIEFQEAAFGAEKVLELYKTVKCEKCKGNGAEPGTKINTCKTCNGSGHVMRVQRTFLGNIQTSAVCPDCKGQGQWPEKPCSKCGGSGIVKEVENVQIKIPAGIDDGEIIKVDGQGEQGKFGAPAGDLYITMKIKPDKRFKREGYNIVSKEKISFPTAVLGGNIDIETIEGPVVMRIPEGTPSGKIFALKGKGITKLRESGKGDHFVEIEVEIPSRLTKRQKEILKEFEEESKKKKFFI